MHDNEAGEFDICTNEDHDYEGCVEEREDAKALDEWRQQNPGVDFDTLTLEEAGQ